MEVLPRVEINHVVTGTFNTGVNKTPQLTLNTKVSLLIIVSFRDPLRPDVL